MFVSQVSGYKNAETLESSDEGLTDQSVQVFNKFEKRLKDRHNVSLRGIEDV